MTLIDWHNERRINPRMLDSSKVGPQELTVITYIYGEREYIDSHFQQIENAIRETWYHLGFLKTVIVTNHTTSALMRFLSQFSDWIRIDNCSTLKSGDLYNYSRDCIENLPKRFETPYMLFIHPDGFPLRGGIEDYLGKYDYIGAPWIPHNDDWIGKILLSQRNFVGNGGFSLRSKKICEAASRIYKIIGRFVPNIFILYEDYFITRFLYRFFPTYRRQIKIAPIDVAAEFSLESISQTPSKNPLGFHSAKAFELLVR